MDNWDGEERRKQPMFCAQHIPLVTSIAKIEETTTNIEKELMQGSTFKNGIVTSLIGVALTLIIQITVFAYLYGMAVNQIAVNTNRLLVLERNAHDEQHNPR